MNTTQGKERLWHRDFSRIAIANLLMAFPFYILMVILPLYLKEELGATPADVGRIQFGFAIMAVIIRPLAGFLLDRYHRKSIYLAFFTLFVACLIGYPFIGGVGAIAALRLLHGIGWGGVSTSGSTIAIDLVPVSRRGEGIGVFGMGMTIATALAPMMGEAILGRSGSYLYTFVAGFAIGVAGLLLATTIRIPKVEAKPKSTGLLTKEAVPIGLVVLTNQTSYGFIMGFLSLYAATIAGGDAGTFFLLYALALLVARYLGGRLFDRFGARQILPAALLIGSLSFVLLGLGNNVWGLYLSALPMGLAFGTIMSTGQAVANKGIPPERRGVVNATYMVFNDGGIALGMLLFGFIVEAVGYSSSALIAAGLPLLAIVIFFLAVRK